MSKSKVEANLEGDFALVLADCRRDFAQALGE